MKNHRIQYSILKRIFIGIFLPSIVFFTLSMSIYLFNFHKEQIEKHEHYIEQIEKLINQLVFSNAQQAKGIKEALLAKESKSHESIHDALLTYWLRTRNHQKIKNISYFYVDKNSYYEGFNSSYFVQINNKLNKKLIKNPSLLKNIKKSEESNDGYTEITCEKSCSINHYQNILPYDNSLGIVKITTSLDKVAQQFTIYEDNIIFNILRKNETTPGIDPLIINKKTYYIDYTSDLFFFNETLKHKAIDIQGIYYIKTPDHLISAYMHIFNHEKTSENINILIYKNITSNYQDLLNFLNGSLAFFALIMLSTLFLVYLLSIGFIKRVQLLYETISMIGTDNYKKSSEVSLLISPAKDELYKTFTSADEINKKLILLKIENDSQKEKLKESVKIISKKHEFIKEIMHKTDNAIMTVNSDGFITSLNRHAEKLFGKKYNLEKDIFLEELNEKSCLFQGEKTQYLHKGITVRTESYIKSASELKNLYYSWNFSYIDSLDQTLIVGTNLTEYRATQEKITMLAERDSLTKTYNRRKAYDILQVWIENNTPFSLLFIDLNNFKTINDSLGHEYGDKILQELSDVLVEVCPDDSLISRFGGDEFVVALLGTSYESVKFMCEKILTEASKIPKNEKLIILNKTSLSIGVSMYPNHGNSIDALMVKSDAAMYENKITRSGTFRIYDGSETLLLEANKQRELRQLINHTIVTCSLICYFQPILDLNNKNRIIYESLARIIKPKTNFFHDTEEFIIESEKIKCIDKIDKFIFETSTKRASEYSIDNKEIVITVNFSKYTIISPGIVKYVENTLKNNKFSAEKIIIEITESADLEGMNGFLENLDGLKKLGIKLALDDYGSGYTSLEYLIKFPIDYLKLDMKIVKAAVTNKDSLSIIKSILDLARNLNMEVIVEGIETHNAYLLYKSLGVYLMQGYYFSQPIPEFIHINSPKTNQQMNHPTLLKTPA